MYEIDQIYELIRKSLEIPYCLVRDINFRLILSRKIPGSWDFAKSCPGNPGIENLDPVGAWPWVTDQDCFLAGIPKFLTGIKGILTVLTTCHAPPNVTILRIPSSSESLFLPLTKRLAFPMALPCPTLQIFFP